MALPYVSREKTRRSCGLRHSGLENSRSGTHFSITLYQAPKFRTVLKFIAAIASITAVASVLFSQLTNAAPVAVYPAKSTGVDVSWPPSNCKAVAPAHEAFGIVGVTGGLDFTQNNCLINEASWFPNLSLYMNTGYPGGSFAAKYTNYPGHCATADDNCLAYNYGYNAAQYALFYTSSQNVHSTLWWLDVETENSWTPSMQQNQAALQGMIAAIKRETFFPTIGIYSTPKQWQQIMGDWHIGLPNWVGTGSSKKSDAVAACRDSDFTAGGTQLTQYILTLDHDYVCHS